MEILGITIPTVIHDTDSVRCEGCHQPIAGQPMRVSILDFVATEAPPSWAARSPINPGPHQFHADEAHVRAWMRRSGYLWCRKAAAREIMRPVPLPTQDGGWGLCDGSHRDDHEFVPA
jgi:hypothetical protein